MIKYFKENKQIINNILLNTATLSFFTLTSLSSLFVLVNFLLDAFSDNFKLTIVFDLIEILGITFSGFVNQTIKDNNSINIILIISLIYSSSSIINRYNKYCDYLYYGEEKRKFYHNRISSVLMFLMLMLILLFSLVGLIFGNTLINLIINNNILSMLISSILELLLFYVLFIVMLIYFPPIKIRFNEVNKGCIVLTLTIYLFFKLFILIFDLLYRRIKIIGLIFVFSLISYLIYIIHFVICFVLFYISKKRNE